MEFAFDIDIVAELYFLNTRQIQGQPIVVQSFLAKEGN